MDILYHYCSTASFHAIVQSHSLWLSSLSLSNDTMEGKLVARVIARLAEKDGLDKDYARRLHEIIEGFERIFDGLGFCLSEDGDLLSQWRGYAADATGVAIGFSSDYLNWLSDSSKGQDESGFTLQRVEYDHSAHELRVEPIYSQAKQFIKDGAFKTPSQIGFFNLGSTDDELKQKDAAIHEANSKLAFTLIRLISELFCLKVSAFREEREWRLLSHLTKNGTDACLHRVVEDRIVPYRKVKLIELDRSPIAEVILGPKHGTPPKIVEDFLKLNRYGFVKVRRSEASYR